MGMFDNRIKELQKEKREGEKRKAETAWLAEWNKKYSGYEDYFIKTYSDYVKEVIGQYIEAAMSINARTVNVGTVFKKKAYPIPGSTMVEYAYNRHILKFFAVTEKQEIYYYYYSEKDSKKVTFNEYLKNLYYTVLNASKESDWAFIWKEKNINYYYQTLPETDPSYSRGLLDQKYLEKLDKVYHAIIEYFFVQNLHC